MKTVAMLFVTVLCLLSSAYSNALDKVKLGFTSESKGLITGWACWEAIPELPINVEVRNIRGELIGFGSSAGATSCQNSMYVIEIPRDTRSRMGPGGHVISIHAYSEFTHETALISGVNMQINGQKTDLFATNGITKRCRFPADHNWVIRLDYPIPHDGCSPSDHRRNSFFIRATNEDHAFAPAGPYWPFEAEILNSELGPWAKPYFTYQFVNNGQNWTIDAVTDKITHQINLDNHSASLFNDVSSISRVYLDKEVFIELDVAMPAHSISTSSAMARATVGILGHWNIGSQQQSVFLEVNLFRDKKYDLCTPTQNTGGLLPVTPCDTMGAFDRRAWWGSGETLYYDVSKMHLFAGAVHTPLSTGTQFKRFTIPVSELFKKGPLISPPSSWDQAFIGGIYFGHEVWGAAMIRTQVKNYRVYSFVADHYSQ